MAKRKDEWILWALGAAVLVYVFRDKLGTHWVNPLVPQPFTGPDANKPADIEVLNPQRTRATFAEMRDAYVKAFRDQTGAAPSQRMLGMLLAQSALETGQWKAMWQWNPANITTLGREGFFRLPNDPHKYAIYSSALEGATAHVSLLARKYPRSMGLMLTDTPEAVARMLSKEGFYEAEPGPYASTMTKLFNQFLPQLPGPVTGDDDDARA